MSFFDDFSLVYELRKGNIMLESIKAIFIECTKKEVLENVVEVLNENGYTHQVCNLFRCCNDKDTTSLIKRIKNIDHKIIFIDEDVKESLKIKDLDISVIREQDIESLKEEVLKCII